MDGSLAPNFYPSILLFVKVTDITTRDAASYPRSVTLGNSEPLYPEGVFH